MNSPFVIYSKRQLYLSILFIVLLLEVFTILPTSSTFVNNGNSLKHKIVQYLNHEKNTAQSSRFDDEDEKNKADTDTIKSEKNGPDIIANGIRIIKFDIKFRYLSICQFF